MATQYLPLLNINVLFDICVCFISSESFQCKLVPDRDVFGTLDTTHDNVKYWPDISLEMKFINLHGRP
jgi:hypothetical protein